jgi:hypothetical protein
MTQNQDTYQLPPELAVAFETGRVEFVNLLRKQVENGRELPQLQIVDLLRLVEHMIIDKQAMQARFQALERVMHFMDDAAKGLTKKSAELRSLIRNLPPPADTDEE